MASSINIETSSIGSMAGLTSTIGCGALILIVSIVIIAAYSHIICFATGLVLRDEQSLEHSNDPDLPQKEKTAALMLTGFLGGIHLMLVFIGLPLFGHAADSFFMKNLLSCAFIAAVTTGLIVAGIVLYLIVPAFGSCGGSLFRRVHGSRKELDAEASVGANQAEEPFIMEKFADDFFEKE